MVLEKEIMLPVSAEACNDGYVHPSTFAVWTSESCLLQHLPYLSVVTELEILGYM